VVRVKGGDPFVFGRGGEEAQACAAAGIPFEVVPGVTSGVAAPAYAGIPVTQRTLAPAVAFVTGHEDPAKPETQLDWAALAAFPGTLVFYMGVRALERISTGLVGAGRDAAQPAAVVQRGTFPDQRVLSSSLGSLAADAAAAGIRAPAITVVGPVAALAGELAWLHDARPLAGRTVVVTRARQQVSDIAAQLRGLGARVLELPAIAFAPLDVELPPLADVDLLCLTSINGVERLFDLVRDARALAGPRIAAIGPGTADALRSRGVEPDLVPARSMAEGILAELGDLPVRRAVVIRAAEGRDELPDGLRARGAEVELVRAYETRPEPLEGPGSRRRWPRTTSSSRRARRPGVPRRGGHARRARAWSPSARRRARVLRELGAEPHVEAAEPTPAALVAAVVADAPRR
jgi:uroporphyrinogen III methyltransferase/synthase